jgi:hypothetical protein
MVATPATNPRPAGESVNEAEARAILEEELGKLRRLSYDKLVSRFADRQETFEVTGETGESYQVELQALWDDCRKRTLLVIGSIDDGGWRAFRPLSNDFIIAPDGSFVGKEPDSR